MVRVERVAKISPAARERLFTPGEMATCDAAPLRAAERYAARFAAKEAVLKAFGTGLTTGMRWHDVEVLNDASGRPYVKLQGRVAEMCVKLGVGEVLLSLSHDGGFAIAMAALIPA